jgi:hypothetical protein
MLLLRCKKHPDYKGIKLPRVSCDACRMLHCIRIEHHDLVFTPKKPKKKKERLCY